MISQTMTNYYNTDELLAINIEGNQLVYSNDTDSWSEEKSLANIIDIKNEIIESTRISDNLKFLLRSNYIDLKNTIFYQPKGADSLSVGIINEWIKKKKVINANKLFIFDRRSYLELVIMKTWLQSKNFLFRNRQKVIYFLKENYYLIEILSEGYEVIMSIFGSSTKIALYVLEDHNIIGFEQLIVKIQVKDDIESALSKLDRFDDVWLLDQLPRIGNLMIFNLEFI